MPIHALKHGQCRWPLGLQNEVSTHFCGKPTGGYVYCEHHHNLSKPQP